MPPHSERPPGIVQFHPEHPLAVRREACAANAGELFGQFADRLPGLQPGKGANADLKIYNLDLTPYGYDVKVENGTWAETYDVLISAIKSCTNSTNRYAMMHIAEDMLMNTGCIVPLYYYTDIYMLDDSVQGFFSNPLGYKYFMHCTIAK